MPSVPVDVWQSGTYQAFGIGGHAYVRIDRADAYQATCGPSPAFRAHVVSPGPSRAFPCGPAEPLVGTVVLHGGRNALGTGTFQVDVT